MEIGSKTLKENPEGKRKKKGNERKERMQGSVKRKQQQFKRRLKLIVSNSLIRIHFPLFQFYSFKSNLHPLRRNLRNVGK